MISLETQAPEEKDENENFANYTPLLDRNYLPPSSLHLIRRDCPSPSFPYPHKNPINPPTKPYFNLTPV